MSMPILAPGSRGRFPYTPSARPPSRREAGTCAHLHTLVAPNLFRFSGRNPKAASTRSNRLVNSNLVSGNTVDPILGELNFWIIYMENILQFYRNLYISLIIVWPTKRLIADRNEHSYRDVCCWVEQSHRYACRCTILNSFQHPNVLLKAPLRVSCIRIINHEAFNVEIRSYLPASERELYRG